MWNFLKYWIWKQWNSNQDTKCCHCKVVFLSCPSFGLLHSAQIQIFFPMKEAIVTTPYSGYDLWLYSIFWKWSIKKMHCLFFKKYLNQLCCAVFLDMQSFLMPPNYFDDGYLAIFLRQLSRRGLLLFYCSQKLTEADTPSSFVVQRSEIWQSTI